MINENMDRVARYKRTRVRKKNVKARMTTIWYLIVSLNNKMKEDLNKLKKIKEIICEVLNIDEIDDSAKQEDYIEWDSLAYLSIISELEDQFNIDISSKNINNFDSVQNILTNITQ